MTGYTEKQPRKLLDYVSGNCKKKKTKTFPGKL